MLVGDLSPGERVVLSAGFADERGQEWSSTAVFEADDEGRVDTSEQAPVEGSYRVEDPMGLVWSALGPGGLYVPSPWPSPVAVTAEVGGEGASAEVERYAMADGVEATDVREGGLVGGLFLPADARPAPGVLVLGGSEGGLAPFVMREAAPRRVTPKRTRTPGGEHSGCSPSASSAEEARAVLVDSYKVPSTASYRRLWRSSALR